MNILTIMLSTFRELTRNKIFFVTIFFCLVFTLISLLYRTLTAYEEVKLMKDVGLAVITVLSTLMAIYTGSSVVSKEIDEKTAQVLLAKPVAKYEFILGKFFGALLTIVTNIIIMGLGFLIIVGLKEHVFFVLGLKAIILICFEMAILTAIAILFSVLISSTVSSIFSFCVFIAGHLVYLLPFFIKKAETALVKTICSFFYYLLPNLDYFNFKNQVSYNEPIPFSVLSASMIYGIVYCSAILLLAILVFRSKELA